MNLVVDTNIIFSAIISDKGKIGELLLNKPGDLNFYSPQYLLDELDIHAGKILSLTGYSLEEYLQIKSLVTKHINFINHHIINHSHWQSSIQLLTDVDLKDAPFLALNLELGGYLWTGDKRLINGLKRKNYYNWLSTDILYSKYFDIQ